MIKSEVLSKIQLTKEELEKPDESAQGSSSANMDKAKDDTKSPQGKRKNLPRNSQRVQLDNVNDSVANKKQTFKVKPFHYRNTNYKKFNN